MDLQNTREATTSARSEARGDVPRIFRGLDFVTEWLVFTVLIFSPWAFGTTEHWSITTVNRLNFLLGLVLVAKWICRAVTGYQPDRWASQERLLARLWPWFVGVLTVFLLGYIGVSAWNSRAIYHLQEQRFEYLEYVPWLPHSYDQAKSWERFYRCLAAACFFWALRDWLLIKTSRDRSGEHGSDRVSERVRRLLWVLCINGTLIAVEGLLQRLTHTNKLLWLVQPEINAWNSGQFGPYAYRSNAAQLFNMIWPATFGFFLSLNRYYRRGFGSGSETILVLCCAILAVCPFLTSSRLGAAVSAGLMISSLGIIFVRRGFKKWTSTAIWLFFFSSVLAGGLWLNWDDLKERFMKRAGDETSGRSEIYANAKKIVADYPVFGVGPGAFGAVYQLYREDSSQYWHAYAHDDWLEARATLGWVGFAAILLLLTFAGSHWFIGSGVPLPSDLAIFIGLGCLGVLLTALGDLPFQIYSLLLVFLAFLAVLSSGVRPRRN